MQSAKAVFVCLMLCVSLCSAELQSGVATETQSTKVSQSAGGPAANVASSETPQVAKRSADGRPVLDDSTPIRMRINRTLSSSEAKTGEQVDFEVLDEVKVAGAVAIPQGSIAMGTVTEAQGKRSMGRAGKLNVNIDYVKLANGQKVALRAVKEVKGGGHVGAMTGAIVATSIVFFPAAPLFLFIHGKDITIPKGTEITAYVNGDVPFTPASLATAHNEVAAAQKSVAPELSINSNPEGADVEIDGAFVGSTPSQIGLDSGDHTVVVKKAGFKSWEKKLHITSGSVTVKAELESEPKQ